MENCQFETLKLSQTPFGFTPHRRRHLKSETFCTLVRIFSHCYDESQLSRSIPAIPADPKQDDCNNELGPANLCDESAGHDHMVLDNTLVQKESLVDENAGVIASQDGGCSHSRMEIDGLNHISITNTAEVHVQDGNMDGISSVMFENLMSDGVSMSMSNNKEHSNVSEVWVEEVQHVGKVEVDMDLSRYEVLKDIDLTLDTDTIDESTLRAKNNEKKGCDVEGNRLEEIQHVLREKVMEHEKFSASGVTSSSFHVTADNEVEEGELVGDIGNNVDLMDFLFDDAMSLEEKRENGVQTLGNVVDKAESIKNEVTIGLVNPINNMHDCMDTELKVSDKILVEDNSEGIVCGKLTEGKNAEGKYCGLETDGDKKDGGKMKFVCSANSPENLELPNRISKITATENLETVLTEKDAGVCNKKRKRGVNKEKRAMKKKIKRAEKNRKLGVKRLKLPPLVLKPKTVTYCHYYLKGRCQQGEMCKFSHDTTPLTKSTPCCHFARYSCMKGDDCPYDHHLSKYPCNNYSSSGYCSRGADCLFSHEMPVKEGFPSAATASRPEMKSMPLPSTKGSNKQLIHGTSHQNVEAKRYPIEIPWNKSLPEPAVKPNLQAPKGISFLSPRTSSLDHNDEHKQAGSYAKAHDGVIAGSQKIQIRSAPGVTDSSNEITKRNLKVVPPGINFLSFGRGPLVNFSDKKSSRVLLNRDHCIEKSPSGNLTEEKQVSSLKGSNSVIVDNLASQTASDIVQNLSEWSRKTPSAMTPRGVNFLSFGRAPSGDDLITKGKASLRNVQDASVQLVPENQSAIHRPHAANAPLWRLPSPSLTSGLSLDQLTASQSNKSTPTPSSFQKSLLWNTPSSGLKALRSTLAFASNVESGIKMDVSRTDSNKDSVSTENIVKNASIIGPM